MGTTACCPHTHIHTQTHTHRQEILAHCPQTLHWLLRADKESVVFFFQHTWNTHTSTDEATTATPVATATSHLHMRKCISHTHTNLPIDEPSVTLYQPWQYYCVQLRMFLPYKDSSLSFLFLHVYCLSSNLFTRVSLLISRGPRAPPPIQSASQQHRIGDNKMH